MLTCAAWREVSGLHHGFLDARACQGGPTDWARTVARVAGGLRLVTLRQVHGCRVVTAEDLVAAGRTAPAATPPEADGVATAMRGVALGVVTADCVPVLLLARRAGIVAAVHAGWRGTAAGVLEATVLRLQERFAVEPSALEACLGPAIGPCCYRVGPEVRNAFTRRTGGRTDSAWRPAGTTLRLDLRCAAACLLREAGVAAIECVGPCTACTPVFASYRRDGGSAGRQLSFIGWD